MINHRQHELDEQIKTGYRNMRASFDSRAVEQYASAKDLANSVLTVLRQIRDDEPEKWDDLVHTDSGVLLLNLWDDCRAIGRTVVDQEEN